MSSHEAAQRPEPNELADRLAALEVVDPEAAGCIKSLIMQWGTEAPFTCPWCGDGTFEDYEVMVAHGADCQGRLDITVRQEFAALQARQSAAVDRIERVLGADGG